MKMRKIVAIVAAALMLFSILPISAMAAGDETITVTGTTGVLDGTSSISWDGTNYQVVNYKDNSTTAIRTSDSAHFRIYVGNEFYVRAKGSATMSKVVINCVSNYALNQSANTIESEGWTMTASGTTVTYTAASGAATELHISIGKQSRITDVTITPGTAGGSDCDHESLLCGDTCPECEEYTKEHVFANNCATECSNGCGTANPNYADHVYDGAYDAACNVCSAVREVNFPEADSELTIPEANEIGEGMSHDTTTSSKYYITGVVESIVNDTYGNLYIQDEEGNKLYIYGTYNEDGTIRYDSMTEKPEVGMTITVYGVVGNYNNAAQMKNVWITEMEGGCEHDFDYECDKNCYLCGLEIRPEASCESNAEYPCQDGLCIYCDNDVVALPHAFDDQYDPDCNYGCGETREVEERPELTEATITFDADKSQRTEYSTTVQKWENDGLVLTNNKGSSTSNVGDYSNPGRFYKGSEIIISFPGMTSLVIDAGTVGGVKYSTPWAETLGAAGLTYENNEEVYTVTFAEPVNSITLTTTAQVRASSITAIAAKASEPEHTCEFKPVVTTEATCGATGLITYTCECGETNGTEEIPATNEHNYTGAETLAPTCGAVGTTTYTCSGCSASYTEEIPATNEHNYTGAETLAPTCGAVGTTTYTCSGCSASYTEDIPATGAHTYNYDCDKTCKVCGLETRPEATHEYFNDCESVCIICYEITRENDHNVIHVEAAAATCYADGNQEYWYCDGCGAAWLNAERTMTTNLRNVIIPMGHGEIEHVAAVAPTCEANGNQEYWWCPDCGAAWLDAECTLNTNLKAVVLPMGHYNVTHVDAVAPTCEADGNQEYWYCEDCGQAWLDANQYLNTNLKAVILPMGHYNVTHVDAVAPTCEANGNQEYWYCEDCGQAWLDADQYLNTNLKAVILPMGHYNVEHVEAKAPTCTEMGNIEYWYCADCGAAWLDANQYLNTNLQAVKLSPTCATNAVYSEGVEPGCHYTGWTENWYCANCDVYYLDADCTIITNYKSLTIPALESSATYAPAVAGNCQTIGNVEYWYCEECQQVWTDEALTQLTNFKSVKTGYGDHVYTDASDAMCNVEGCGSFREVDAEAFQVITCTKTTSASPDVRGLGFKYNAKVNGLGLVSSTQADYTNATITINGEEHKLVGMGAFVSNGIATKKVLARYLCEYGDDNGDENGTASFAVRVINIPVGKENVLISIYGYYELEGGIIIENTDLFSSSYAAALSK